jgi:hypothetical protein
MSSKIRIKMGDIEIEYEGSEEFLRAELPELLSAVSELYHKTSSDEPAPEGKGSEGGDDHNGAPHVGTTATIAARLQCESGPDLALAAAGRIVLGLKREAFTRQELHAEMKSARSFYSKNMGSNLSSILNGLVKAGKFNEVSSGNYTLAQADRTRIESLLGDAGSSN